MAGWTPNTGKKLLLTPARGTRSGSLFGAENVALAV